MSEDLFNVLHSMPSFNGSDVSIFNFPRLTIDVVRAARAQANPSLSSTVSVEQSRDLRHSNHEISTRAQQGSSDVTPDTGSVAAQFHPRKTAGHDPNTISLIVSSSSMLNSPEGNIRSSQSQSSEEGSSRRATHIQDDSHRSPVWSLQIHSDEKGENSAVDRTIEWRHPDVEAHQGLSIDHDLSAITRALTRLSMSSHISNVSINIDNSSHTHHHVSPTPPGGPSIAVSHQPQALPTATTSPVVSLSSTATSLLAASSPPAPPPPPPPPRPSPPLNGWDAVVQELKNRLASRRLE